MINFLTVEKSEAIVDTLIDKIQQSQAIDPRLVQGLIDGLTLKEAILILPIITLVLSVSDLSEGEAEKVAQKCLDCLEASTKALNVYLLAQIDINKPASYYNDAVSEKVEAAMQGVRDAMAILKQTVEPAPVESTAKLITPIPDNIWD